MHPDDTNLFASNIIDRYENQPDNLHSICLADLAPSYVSKKVDDLPIEPDEIKSYTVLESNVNNVKLNPDIIILKNEFGEMQKRSQPCVICFYKVSKLKSPEEHYLRLLQLYMPWRNENELKQDNQSYEDRHKELEDDILWNIKKHEKLQNFNFVQSDEGEDNAEFSMINPNLLDQDLEDSDNVINATAASKIIGNLLHPNEQFYEICSQHNEGQQHLFNFIMEYALHCKLAEKNNVLPPKPFRIFLSGGAGIGKAFLIKAITEY